MRNRSVLSISSVLAFLVILLSACTDPPTSGYITSMPYQAESYWYSTECGMYRTVTRTRSSTTYDSKGRPSGMRISTYTESVCVMWLQRAHVNPPSWEICLVGDDNKDHRGCLTVSQATYRQYQVGQHYPNPQ